MLSWDLGQLGRGAVYVKDVGSGDGLGNGIMSAGGGRLLSGTRVLGMPHIVSNMF